jgi:hypothetical protein
MMTLAELIVSWIYISLPRDEKHLPCYIKRPGFLIGDRISIRQLTTIGPWMYDLGDVALGYRSDGWVVALMGRLITSVDTLEGALKIANALEGLVEQNRIHGTLPTRDDAMYCVFDDKTLEAIFETVDAALA